MIGTTAAIVGSAIAAGGAIGGAALSSRAAGKAADAQTAAAEYAATLQKQAADDALAFQREQFETSQNNLAPWLEAGKGALGGLTYGMGLGTMQANKNPLAVNEQNYQLSSDPIVQIPAGMDFYGQKTARLSQIKQWLDNQEQSGEMGRAEGYSDLKGIYDNAWQQAMQAELEADPNKVKYSTEYALTPGAGSGEGGAAGTGYGDLMRDFTMADYEEDPGYQFRITEGQKAIDKTAAAKGRALSGGAVKAQTRYASDLASQEYGNAWNRYQAEQANKFNRLSALAGTGQTSANTLSGLGQNYAGNVGNILTGTAQGVGDMATQAANARASGYAASGNAWNNAIGGTTNNLLNTYLMSQMNKSSAPYDTTYLYDIANFG